MSRRIKEDVEILSKYIAAQSLTHRIASQDAGSVSISIQGIQNFALYYVDCESYPATSVLISTVQLSLLTTIPNTAGSLPFHYRTMHVFKLGPYNELAVYTSAARPRFVHYTWQEDSNCEAAALSVTDLHEHRSTLGDVLQSLCKALDVAPPALEPSAADASGSAENSHSGTFGERDAASDIETDEGNTDEDSSVCQDDLDEIEATVCYRRPDSYKSITQFRHPQTHTSS
jgi:hypothetical protein